MDLLQKLCRFAILGPYFVGFGDTLFPHESHYHMDILPNTIMFGGIEEVDGHICFGQRIDDAGHVIPLHSIVDRLTDGVFHNDFVSLQGV